MTCSDGTDIVWVDFCGRLLTWPCRVCIHIVSLTSSALLVMKTILFILDCDSNYLEYYFGMGKRL
jgi:hypothetical protein